MTELLGVKIAISPWLMTALIIAATVLGAFIARSVVLWAVRRVARQTRTELDDRIYRLLERYLFPMMAVGGFLLLVDAVPLPQKTLQVANRLLIIIAGLMTLFFLTNGSLVLLRKLQSQSEAARNIKGPVEIFTKIIFVVVGGMIILDNLGISLTPIITTLGIGSLAVAIALQDTLGNFFAGLYIKADRPIKVGHYIRLENGQEGYVDRMGWRSTHIRALQNNIIVVPNSKLAQNIVTNFHLPEKRMALLIPIAMSYDSDPQAVEDLLMDEVKKAIGEVDGLLAHPEPFVRFIPGFGDFSLNFTLICQVREFVDQYWVQHELRKRIFRRLHKEGMQEAIRPLVRAAFAPLERSQQN